MRRRFYLKSEKKKARGSGRVQTKCGQQYRLGHEERDREREKGREEKRRQKKVENAKTACSQRG